MAEKKVIEIEIQDNSKTLKQQYKEAVLEVQKLADAFGATSIEVQNASKKAAELKDQIEDVNDAIQAQKGEGAFIALGKSLSSVASGFSAVEGAMGLVGAESEDVQKAMLRVQSAMALAQGLEGLEDAGRAFSQLKTIVTSFGTTAVNAFKAMSTASKAFLVTGIGLLIAGLGTAIAYWDDISKAIGLASNEQDTYAKQQKRINEQAKESRESVAKESGAFATLISRLKETNAGSKERDTLIKKINTEYGTTLKNIKDETKFQEQLNTELASYLEYQKAKYELQKNEEKIVKNLEVQDKLESDISKAKKEQVALEKERQDLIKKQSSSSTATSETKIFSDYDKITKKIAEVDSKIQQNKKTIQDSNKELENAQKRFEDYGRSANNASAKVDELTNSGSKYVENNKDVKDSTIETNKDLAKTLEDLTEKNKQFGLSEQELLLLSKLKTDALIQEQFLKSTDKDKEKQRTDALLANETDYNNQLNALRKKEVSDLETLKTQSAKDGIAQLVATRTTELEIEKNTADKKLAIEKSLQEHKAELRQKDFDLALQGIGVIKSIFERSKGVQKAAVIAESAIGIAKIITSTQAANAAAIAKYSAIPGGQAFSAAEIARNRIGAGIGIAANLTATAKALQALGGGSAPSGGGDLGGGGGGVIAPNLNIVGNTGINQLATLQQQPVKAYVVSNDITSAQQFDLKVQQTASL